MCPLVAGIQRDFRLGCVTRRVLPNLASQGAQLGPVSVPRPPVLTLPSQGGKTGSLSISIPSLRRGCAGVCNASENRAKKGPAQIESPQSAGRISSARISVAIGELVASYIRVTTKSGHQEPMYAARRARACNPRRIGLRHDVRGLGVTVQQTSHSPVSFASLGCSHVDASEDSPSA